MVDTTAHSSRALGRRIQRLRKLASYSLADVATGTKLSRSFLSLLENGKTDVSIGRLMRIADFLGVTLPDLISPAPNVTGYAISRSEEGLRVRSEEGIEIRLLAPTLHHTNDYRLTTFEPGAELTAGEGYDLSTPGEMFIYIIRGKIELHLRETTALVLEAGDSATFEKSLYKSARNLSAGQSVLLGTLSNSAPLRAGIVDGARSVHQAQQNGRRTAASAHG